MLKFDRSAMLRHAAASTALSGALLLVPQMAQAQDLPTNGTVVSGGVTIGSDGTRMTVTQTTDRAIINWSSFDVGSGKVVEFDQGFDQSSASRAVLNRVTGTTGSTIAGTISAGGSVYLVNPNGIAITSTGQVQTGGNFIASTLGMTDEDFNNDVLSFAGTGASKRVSNAGAINAGFQSGGGIVALLGATVSLSGSIVVDGGRLALGSGEAITLDVNGGQFLQVAVPTNAVTDGATALIEMATGSYASALNGRVEIRAATAVDAVRNVINMSGVVNGGDGTGAGPAIVVQGTGGGLVKVSGELNAQGVNAPGGEITITGGAVDITGLRTDASSNLAGEGGRLIVTARQIAVDAGFAAAVSDNLARNGFALIAVGTNNAGNGKIAVNSALSWGGTNRLLLSAGSIDLNASITAPNGQLSLQAGETRDGPPPFAGPITASGAIDVSRFRLSSGNWVQNATTLPDFYARNFSVNLRGGQASFLRVTGGDGSVATPYKLVDMYGVQGIASRSLLSRNFVVMRDLFEFTRYWNDGQGFLPIGEAGNEEDGTPDTPFTGSLDGGLADGRSAFMDVSISRSDELNVGLFGLTSGARLSNLNLSANIAGSGISGGLVGRATNNTIIRNVVVSGSIQGVGGVGGLVGILNDSQIIDSSTNAETMGQGLVGGLVGGQYNGSITRSSTSGRTVSSGSYVGGLVGALTGSGTIDRSFATGEVRGADSTGGLVGGVGLGSSTATVTNSYATGNVTGIGFGAIGGLVGTQLAGTTIRNVYASGTVTGEREGSAATGGLIGRQFGGSLSFAYATGSVTGDGPSGGLIGRQDANGIVRNVWTSGRVSGSGLAGGLIGNSAGQVGNAYWDRWTSEIETAFGNDATVAATVGSVSSAQPQAGEADDAFSNASYANLTGASGIGTAAVSGFAFMPGNSTRPFLAFEVPSATSTPVVNGAWTIRNAHELQLIAYNAATLRASYRTGNSIDVGETRANVFGVNSPTMWNSGGFVPIGTDGRGNVFDGTTFKAMGTINSGKYGFTGTFDGTGSTIYGLVSLRDGTSYVGLFGVVQGALSNIALSGVYNSGNGIVGGLVGYMYRGGSVTGSSVAGLVRAQGGIVGGLVGAATAGSRVTLSSSSAQIYGSTNAGGLIGYASGAIVSRSMASASVVASQYVGGLIGYASQTAIDNSYVDAPFTIEGSVGSVGGLIGKIVGGSVTNSYAQTRVAAPRDAGGLIGKADATARIVSSYWNTETSGLRTSAGGTGRTTEQMENQATYAGWNFDTIWLAPDSGSGRGPGLQDPNRLRRR